ncbi:MAG: hypothetical protein ACYCVB_12065 [Bacilli bacterium]
MSEILSRYNIKKPSESTFVGQPYNLPWGSHLNNRNISISLDNRGNVNKIWMAVDGEIISICITWDIPDLMIDSENVTLGTYCVERNVTYTNKSSANSRVFVHSISADDFTGSVLLQTSTTGCMHPIYLKVTSTSYELRIVELTDDQVVFNIGHNSLEIHSSQKWMKCGLLEAEGCLPSMLEMKWENRSDGNAKIDVVISVNEPLKESDEDTVWNQTREYFSEELERCRIGRR